jgi:hypothetical protein
LGFLAIAETFAGGRAAVNHISGNIEIKDGGRLVQARPAMGPRDVIRSAAVNQSVSSVLTCRTSWNEDDSNG